jgi:putative MFS transporter
MAGRRIGRRASILYAGIIFIATAICGAMPEVHWNLAMCFIMGVGVGGMLPITYALLAETIPARHRGWMMILIGADIAGAYILTSWIAVALVPTYGWRILWLIGLPTGMVFIMLNRWIPESPRFLLATGREAEARSVMARYGAAIVDATQSEMEVESEVKSRWSQLVSPQFLGLTLVVGCLALGSGLVLFGFNLWIPSNLRKLGFTEADAILRNSALIGFPLTFLVAWMYGFWSSKKTIIILASLTAAALFGFVVAGISTARTGSCCMRCSWCRSGASARWWPLSVYSSRFYPTHPVPATGFAAGARGRRRRDHLAGCIRFATPSIATACADRGNSHDAGCARGHVFGIETYANVGWRKSRGRARALKRPQRY